MPHETTWMTIHDHKVCYEHQSHKHKASLFITSIGAHNKHMLQSKIVIEARQSAFITWHRNIGM